MDPKQLKYTKFSEVYSLDREKNSLKRLNFESKNDGDTLTTSVFKKDTSKKAYMVKTSGVHEGFRLEINENGVRTHTVQISTPSYLNHLVPDLDKKPCLYGPKALTPHGKVCYVPNLTDSTLMWSPDGTKLMYLAERAKKIHNIHGKVPDSLDDMPLKLEDYLSGFNYRNDWGDTYFDFYNLEIYIYDLSTKILGRVELEENIIPGFPRWLNDSSIVFTGYDNNSFLTGLKYTMNKRSAIYVMKDIVPRPVLNLSNEKVFITAELRAQFSKAPKKISTDPLAQLPTPGPKGDIILYMYVEKWKDSHQHTPGLKMYRLSTGETKILISDTEEKDENGEVKLAFYANQGYISNNYHWIDEETIIIPSSEKNCTVLNKINITTGERFKWKMVFDFHTEFVKVLNYDTKGGFIFRKCNFYHYSTLGYVKDLQKCFENEGKEVEIIYEERRLDPQNMATIELGSMFEERVTHKDAPDVEGFLWGLKEHNGLKLDERPAFLFLHGGPHSLRHCIYDPAFNTLINRGFLILNVNFSGTWSYGSEFNERINGNLGDKDVKEIVNIVTQL